MMSAEGKISVIVPNYNYAHYLPELLACLQQQSYPNWECIIVDDGSSDNSIELIESAIKDDSRIILIQQENAGPAAARANGIQRASGDYIQLIDADDYISKEKFERALNIFNEQPSIDIVYSDYRFVDVPFTTEWKEDFRKNKVGSQPFIDFLSRWELDLMIPIHAFLFRKSCFDRWGSMDPQFQTHEDWDLHLNFSLNGARYHYDDHVGAYYRIHGSSSSRTDLTKNRRDIALVLAKYLSLVRNDFEKRLWRERYFQAIASFIIDARVRKQINWQRVMDHPIPHSLKRAAVWSSPLYLIPKIFGKLAK